MDDFTTSGLHESKNEWGARLLTILTPHIIEGFRSILEESVKLCRDNDEMDKYLMTFQNFISRIPKWSNEIVTTETNRIIEKSGCQYLEDLITCVHVVQLKALTCIRVGQKQKKVDIDIPKLKDFVHKCYIHVARKLYANIFLFEKDIPALQKQKNSREFELIVKEGVINAVRESIPVEQILRSYLDETTEEDVEVQEEIIEEEKPLADDNSITREVTEILNKDEKAMVLKTTDNLVISKENTPIKLDIVDTLSNNSVSDTGSLISSEDVVSSDVNKSITFNDTDRAMTPNGLEENIAAPKTIERLEKISYDNNEKRKLEEMDDFEDDDNDKLTIGAPIASYALSNIETISSKSNPPILLDNIEVLS